jgi:class 3 adenylate cyclase/tetratricopeptide (TPR) repeat protein
VKTCRECGGWSPDRARFCSACGARLGEAATPEERRKLVTVIFADVVGSTALGERVDSETLRWAMQRWSERMRDVIEAHGGMVEKYVGDSVMAVFGVPMTHEDDALRAVRAAAEMREQATALSDELRRERGVEVHMRVGVNTGEATTGAGMDGGVFTTGDIVNVAARLEQNATPGQVLLGRETMNLVAHAVGADPVEPLVVKGKTDPVEAFALASVVSSAPGRAQRVRAPMVGRSPERQRLFEAFDRAVNARKPQLVTVFGDAGIGKSRLADEVTAALRDTATVATGRCLPYGNGLTWWPLAEALAHLGIDQRAHEILAGGAVAPDDAFLALRTTLETLAQVRPFVLVIDDLHWGDAPLLDFLEHLLAHGADAPLLVVALARPELREARPGWGATGAITLAPLAPTDAGALLAHLVGPAGLGGGAADRILAAAEGYPLFLEEVVAMLVDDGVLGPSTEPDDIAIPATIQALLAARLDRLTLSERATVQAAAVVGKEFAVGQVETLRGEPARATLVALEAKELIEPLDDETFRFCHQLIRDVAYEGIVKHERADLHEQLANALVGSTPEEVLGYHLERAVLLRRELGEPVFATATLAARAIASLATAARRAMQRADPPASIGLLERATALTGSDAGARAALLPALGESLLEAGRMAEANTILNEAIQRAPDARVAALARVEREFLRLQSDMSTGTDPGRQVVEVALQALDGDERGLSRTWYLQGYLDWYVGQIADAEAAWERAAENAQRAGAERELYSILGGLATAFVIGPMPVEEAIERCETLRRRVADSPVTVGWMVNPLATLHAMRGEFDLAEERLREANDILRRLGSLGASVSHHEPWVWRLAGRLDLAETSLRDGIRAAEQMGAESLRGTSQAFLAQVLYEQDRVEEAGACSREAAAIAAGDDILTQVVWRGAGAKALAREGRTAEAEALAREGVVLAEKTDLLSLGGDAMLDLAEVLQLGGNAEDAQQAVQAAVSQYERKGNMVAAARARALADNESGRR